MIRYKRGGRWHLFNIFLCRGSVFPASFIMAGPSAVISFLLKWYDVLDDGGDTSVLLNSAAWSGFSSLVGFLVVFRTSEAFSRFWDGCSATHAMRAEWIDACSALMAFCTLSTADEFTTLQFKHLLVRLFSLLHAMALGEIEEGEGDEGLAAFDLELIDPSGLDAHSWKSLMLCHNKTTLVFTWLQTVIVDNIKTGVLSIPPPILSRVFQELANGMIALHEAQKIAHIPFPFPYAQTCDALLFLHWLITPLVTAQWASAAWSAGIFGFVQVFILWSLNKIAVEIEHPFGRDDNDLDTAEMQLEMNMNLLLVLDQAATRAPFLTQLAQIQNLTKLGRRASKSVHAFHEATYNEIVNSAMVADDASREIRRLSGMPFVERFFSDIVEMKTSTLSTVPLKSTEANLQKASRIVSEYPMSGVCDNPQESLPTTPRVSSAVQPELAFGGTPCPQRGPAADALEGMACPPDGAVENTENTGLEIARSDLTGAGRERGSHNGQLRAVQASEGQCHRDQGGVSRSQGTQTEQMNAFQEDTEQCSLNQDPAHGVKGLGAEPIVKGEAECPSSAVQRSRIQPSFARRELL